MSVPAFAEGFGPWRFGMSAEEIRAVQSYGPYREFSNGDLETYNADFGGKKQNAQFYLKNGKLWRIAIRTYEGKDLTQAATTWSDTNRALNGLYGSVKTFRVSGKTYQETTESARSIVADGGTAQMEPAVQPPGDLFVYGTFNAVKLEGVTYYLVTVNYIDLILNN